MAAFDGSAFDASFDIGGGGAGGVDTGAATAGLSISVVSPLVFSSSSGSISWAPLVVVGAVDVSARLSGSLKISAAEDSARVATLTLIPASAADLDGYEGQAVTIDVTLFRTGQAATWRLFTGCVERSEFSLSERLVTLSCRDGWQERPAACASAAQVEALLGGLATTSGRLLPWSDAEPDPVAYFNGLLETIPGATAIDSSGVWQVVRWDIGAPAATFPAGEVFDGSIDVITAARADVPSAVHATLAVRGHRLHSAEVDVDWNAVHYSLYILHGLPTLQKATVLDALGAVSGWGIRGTPAIVEPTPGSYGPVNGSYYLVSAEQAALICQSFTATLYRRWYQEAEIVYSITVDAGGASSRDDSVRASISSDFDASAWESAPRAAAISPIYAANDPHPPSGTPTGYEGLPEPHPPTNSGVDHFGDITTPDLQAAVSQVVARAMRRAAAGRRRRTVRFARPLDPRWEIGAVLAINAGGVSATGQVSEVEHEMNVESGALSSTFTLAVPDGNGAATGYTATASVPANSVIHNLPDQHLTNWVGSSFETIPDPDPDTVQGFLCNVDPRSDNYDSEAPAYVTQFRLVMPDIAAPLRDPLTVETAITGAVTVSSGSLEINF
jgi:hypothetical protein